MRRVLLLLLLAQLASKVAAVHEKQPLIFSSQACQTCFANHHSPVFCRNDAFNSGVCCPTDSSKRTSQFCSTAADRQQLCSDHTELASPYQACLRAPAHNCNKTSNILTITNFNEDRVLETVSLDGIYAT